MRYISTRGDRAALYFDEILLAGLARDDGLFVPASWPSIDPASLGLSFAEVAARILEAYAEPRLELGEIESLARAAFATFGHPETAPLRQIDDEHWLLELFHGPTLSFKDVAIQLIARLFERALASSSERATILCATSGDTGAAAVEAFRGSSRVSVVVLHPKGRISEVQRRMMTTVREPNIVNLAVAGTFDDCQTIVKALLAEERTRAECGLRAINSINWARLAVQSVYYFTALTRLGRSACFSAPTGNFGDAFSGYCARRMGAPIERLCVAVNHNDVVHRAIAGGVYRPAAVVPSSAPSIDIQAASNFERLMFEALGRDATRLRPLMNDLAATGSYRIPADARTRIDAFFVSESVSEAESAATMAALDRTHGILIDPHTAVGLAAARKARTQGRFSGPVITLATAHPAKFPEAVYAATQRRAELPSRFADILSRPERIVETPARIDAVREIIVSRLGRP